MGLRQDIINAKIESQKISAKLFEGENVQPYDPEVTPEIEIEATLLRDAIVKFITSNTWTIAEMKASLEVEDIKTTGPLGVTTPPGVGVQVGPTVTWKLIVNGPVDAVPQSGLNPVFTNLQPGPKFNPLGYVFCKSHNQYPVEPPGFNGVVIGVRLVQPAPKLIWNAIIQFTFNCIKVPSV